MGNRSRMHQVVVPVFGECGELLADSQGTSEKVGSLVADIVEDLLPYCPKECDTCPVGMARRTGDVSEKLGKAGFRILGMTSSLAELTSRA